GWCNECVWQGQCHPNGSRDRTGGQRRPHENNYPLAPAHGTRGVTVNTPPSLRPCTAGLYISSACAGGRMNVPGVVARATYVALYRPVQSTVATYTTRSSRSSL